MLLHWINNWTSIISFSYHKEKKLFSEGVLETNIVKLRENENGLKNKFNCVLNKVCLK